MQNDNKSGALPPEKRNGSKPSVYAPAFDGRKQWLSRRDIENEYGWSYKTTQRLEHAGKLIPSVIDAPAIKKKSSRNEIGKAEDQKLRKPRIKLYYRPHIEALLHSAFTSLNAVQNGQEVTI